ncbi:MAG: LysM peptidoglycan-binding domain-containing protein [Chloroflexi bacterium]|nr:LysM peptidoglycan-binding domain-containing protein [Chloroflexota bacterium]
MRTRYAFGIALLVALWTIFPSRSIATVEASPVQNGYTTHVVAMGETLYSIARMYGVSPQAIAAENGLVNPNYIYAGQSLVIPGSYGPGYNRPPAQQPGAGGGLHRVMLGETLYSIAAQYGTTVSALLAANDLANPNYIYAGQQLRIPGGAPSGPWQGPGSGSKPGCGGHHLVKPGETLSGIAWYYGTGVNALAQANSLRFPYIIYAGQSLHVPCGGGPWHDAPPPHKPGHPAPKPAPSKPRLQPAACPREIQIVLPKMNEHISGTTQIIGTASIPDFQFYKVEYAMGSNPLDSAYASIGEVHRTAVTDSILATWYTGNMPAGSYSLRLTAVDNRGQALRPCDVRIHIDR